MSARGSALQRALSYFREAQIDEARVAFQLAEELMTKRLEDAEAGEKVKTRTAPATPRKKRRTKAQIAADQAAMQAHTATPRPAEEVDVRSSLADA